MRAVLSQLLLLLSHQAAQGLEATGGCCPLIEISSRGQAARQQPQRLGVYQAQDVGWSDRPIYRHRQHGEHLFYLQSRSKGLWMIGPKVGHFDGGLASPADNICPQDIAQGQWRYTDGKAWQKDPELQVKCIDATEPEESVDKNEVNGKFRIVSLKWDEHYNNPKSLKYKNLAHTIENDLMTMLMEKDDLKNQADFNVKVERFKRGSVVVNFKVDYNLKDAVIAVPFKLRPENVSTTLAQDFQYQNGILFRRFAIPADSFNGTIFRDHCAIRGCSHKCDYDYDREDYSCTCPRLLVLDDDGKTCQSPNDDENEIPDETSNSKSIEGEITSIKVLTTTERESDIGNRIGKVKSSEETITLVSVPLPNLTTLNDPTTTQSIEPATTTTAAVVSDYDTTTPGSELGDVTRTETPVHSDDDDDDDDDDTTSGITEEAGLTTSTASPGQGGAERSTAITDVITITTDGSDRVTEDQTDAAKNKLEHTTDNKELTTTPEITDSDIMITTEPETEDEKMLTDETTTAFSLTEDETSPIRNIRQDVASNVSLEATTGSHVAATAKPDVVVDAETTTFEAETVTDLLINEDETKEQIDSEITTISESEETSTDVLSQEATTSKATIEDSESTADEDSDNNSDEDSDEDSDEEDDENSDEHSGEDSEKDFDENSDKNSDEEFDEESLETSGNEENLDKSISEPLIIFDEDDEALTTTATTVLDLTTIRVINIKSEQLLTTTVSSNPKDEAVTEISMEVMDDKNAVINVPGMYTIKCNVTETKDLEVTLQRTAAFSFPIRVNNNIDFDGIDLNCHEVGGRQRGVHLIIDKARVRGDITRIWEDNVRLIVDSLLIEDISPK